MTWTLRREYRFEAAHRLPNVPPKHKCGRMHGHSYRATVRVSGTVLDERGMVLDFAEIDGVVTPWIAMMDHTTLNDHTENPTSENLARWLWMKCRAAWPDFAVTVEVSETDRSGVLYEGE